MFGGEPIVAHLCEEGSGVKESDSTITCEYCGKKLPSKEMDAHLFSEHGMTA
jgi:hypothetical protein